MHYKSGKMGPEMGTNGVTYKLRALLAVGNENPSTGVSANLNDDQHHPRCLKTRSSSCTRCLRMMCRTVESLCFSSVILSYMCGLAFKYEWRSAGLLFLISRSSSSFAALHTLIQYSHRMSGLYHWKSEQISCRQWSFLECSGMHVMIVSFWPESKDIWALSNSDLKDH